MSKTPRVMPTKRVHTMQTDSLHNLLSGMGGAGDKTMFTQFGHVTMQRDQIEAAYRNDWISRKVIDIPANDATREWRTWQADKDDMTTLFDGEKKFRLQRKVKQALQKARLYGGAALVLGVDQGKPEDEVDVENIKQDALQFVHVVSCHDIAAGPLVQDVMSPFYGEPEYYTRNTGNVLKLHPSRVVKFTGLELPDAVRMSSSTWGDPVLQIVRDAILAAGSVSQSIAQLIHEAKLDVIRIPDLTAQINNPDYEARLRSRFGLASDAKSIFNMLLLDKEEEWQRIVSSFTSLDSLLQLYLLMASGAADIPATRMLGQAPIGMNATGESDIRNYYDRIATEQSTEIEPALERMDEIFIRSCFGTKPEEMWYEWTPLWQMDEAEEAELQYKKAQTFKIDVDTGVLDGAVLKEARENQLIEDGTYPGIEATIEELSEEFEEPVSMLTAPGIDPETGLPMPLLPAPNAANRPGMPGNKDTPIEEPESLDHMVDRVRLIKVNRRTRIMARGKSKKRLALADATPRTLYVRRDVLNHKDLTAHFKKQGLKTTTGASMHVTLAFSRKHVDWMKAGESWDQDKDGKLSIIPGGVRMVEKLGGATALLFASRDLCWRWESIKERTGADWSWPDYQPHVTISWDVPASVDVTKMVPYRGVIELGPEIFEEINEDWSDLVVEDAKAKLLWDWTPPRRRR